nr:4-hydroxyphenylacetate 3-hydroxylase N-terminal domain-containing protein [uncultured Shimia sp.]
MIRTGAQYRESISDQRAVYVNGERVSDVSTHSCFASMVDLRARFYDLQHSPSSKNILTFAKPGAELKKRCPIGSKLPYSQSDWWAKRRATDHILSQLHGVVSRLGDETLGEMWSLLDAAEVLSDIAPQFRSNINTHIDGALTQDLFQVSASTDPKGNRAKLPQDQDPDMLLHVVRETDAGIVVRGAKFCTGAAYANRVFVKPSLSNWGDEGHSNYAVGFICDLNAPNLKIICRAGQGEKINPDDYPLASRFDETDVLLVFDDVLVEWDDVLFYRSTKAAKFVHGAMHRYTAFAFLQRLLRFADLMIGAAFLNVRQTGLEGRQGVQEKLAQLACYRESINAHLTACIALAERSPAGLMMPNQSLLYTGRVMASGQLSAMMQISRELCSGQICLTPDVASFEGDETGPWLEKYYHLDKDCPAEDRRKLMAFARDLLNSDYAGHWQSFYSFGQSPSYAQLAAVYRNFGWNGPLDLVADMANLPGATDRATQIEDSAVSNWFAHDIASVTTKTAV